MKMQWIKLLFLFLCGHLIYCIKQSKIEDLESKRITFIKCKCPKDQIEFESTCIESNYTNIELWDIEAQNQTILDLRVYDDVVIQPLKCPEHLSKIVYHDLALFTSEGKLFVPSEPETNLYCIENTILYDQPINRIEICVSPMKVPLCCNQDEFLSATDRCMEFHTNQIPIAQSRWPPGFDYTVDFLHCQSMTFASYELVAPSFFHSLELRKMMFHFDFVYNGSFCIAIQEASSFEYLIKYCNQSCIDASCVPSCCPLNYIYDVATHGCIPHSKINTSTHHKLIDGLPSQPNEMPSTMNCTDQGLLTFSENNLHAFMSNSSLVTSFNDGSSSVVLEADKYCLGNMFFTNGSIVPSGLLCLFEQKEESCVWRWTIIRAMLIISSLFILGTLVVYLGVPDLRRRIQGACLISELVALLISQINLVILQLNQNEFSPNGCLTAGVIELIFILASFFWLNVICYDVWSTFRKVRPFNENLLDKKVFAKYSLYAWGIPLLVGIVVIIVEKAEFSGLRPTFNLDLNEGCFFNNRDIASQWAYMYSIILVLLLINCGFFGHLAIRLLSQLEQRKAFKGSTSRSTAKDSENFKLYLKLFIIMGLPWLCEIFSTFALEAHQCYVWIVDLINLFRGVFIFVIFVFKQTTREKIVAAWCNFPREAPPTASEERSRKTSLMSLSSWFPSISRKVSKSSLDSGGLVQLGTVNSAARIPEEEEEEEGDEEAIRTA